MYAEVGHEFRYDSKGGKGPDKWGSLDPAWRACSTGKMQSRNYVASHSVLQNTGHNIMLKWESGAGSIVLSGTEYQLQQIHWHSPSEHVLKGIRYNMEAHLVHKSRDGKVAVISILYKFGQPDPFLASLENHLKAVTDKTGAETVVGVTNPMSIHMESPGFYRYIGSLTTPPCTENVIWTILTQVRTVSREQEDLIRIAANDESGTNARPLQPLNGRLVTLSKLR
ncbi:alpha carbonic anhydrase 7-like [Rutidosis leptorrhynchoides]|uniref:alpha carbonic anhydrase 7-like n=1 Tax=Rutidosis leptorrhynchoides TaxID=125765 RepID=UPI003A9A584D